MRKTAPGPDQQSVFLNVPFDHKYAPLFIALIAGLTALGRKPRCVLEVASSGPTRLNRIVGLIAECGASIHDVSRVGLYGSMRLPRFNMPFEAGLAYPLFLHGGHHFFVLERKPFRLQATLSDLNGCDPQIHGGTQIGVLRCILDCFAKPKGNPPLTALKNLTRRLSRAVGSLQREHRVDSPFFPHVFRQATEAALELAKLEKLID